MSEPGPRDLDRALRRLHRSVLVSLAFCAVAIALFAFAGPAPSDEPLAPHYTWIALALAGLAILLRRSAASPGRSLRAFVYGSVASLLGAVGLGLLGLAVALRDAEGSTGLLYTLAGALLALRPPPPLASGPTES